MKLTIDERWDLIDKISKEVVSYGKYEHTLKDALGELTVKPLAGIPIAITVLYGFWSVFSSFAGTLWTDGFMVKIFDEHFLPWMQAHFPGEGGWLYYIVVGDPAADNCFEAFGVLTSGLFVAIGVVLGAILIFYLMLTLLEDVGYMPRLAVLIDTILHKIGLHGYAIVPTILSLGCNVPAITATRILETRKTTVYNDDLACDLYSVWCSARDHGRSDPRYHGRGCALSDNRVLHIRFRAEQDNPRKISRNPDRCASLSNANEAQRGEKNVDEDEWIFKSCSSVCTVGLYDRKCAVPDWSYGSAGECAGSLVNGMVRSPQRDGWAADSGIPEERSCGCTALSHRNDGLPDDHVGGTGIHLLPMRGNVCDDA